MTNTQLIEVRDSVVNKRYEATVDGFLARLDYDLAADGNIVLQHTEVPNELRGRGIGTQVVAGALNDARERGLKVIPICSMVVGYMKKHPETHDLLAPGASLASED